MNKKDTKQTAGGKPLRLKMEKGDMKGYLIGQVMEIPGIIVQAKTEAQLLKEAAKSLAMYAEQFPRDIFEIVPSEPEMAGIDRARQEVERQIVSLPHDPTTCSVCSGASISSLYGTPILPEGSHPDNHGTFGVHHPSNTCDYCRAEEEDERVLDALSDDPEMDESEPE